MISNKKILILTITLLTFLFVFQGCESSTDSPETGSLVVKVTDAPFPFETVESAVVTINKIEIRKKSNDGEEEGNPFRVVSEKVLDFNLLELRNGLTSELPEIQIPVGSYDLVRLYVESAKITLKDNAGEFDLTVPSGAQTGIKIFINPSLEVSGGLTSELILDFDLGNSFVVQGNPNSPAGINGFHFTPVIRAVNNSTAGRIGGFVKDDSTSTPLQNALVEIKQDTSVVSSAATDSTGYYEIIGLPAGTYNVNSSYEGYTDKSEDVTIVAGNKTETNFNLTK